LLVGTLELVPVLLLELLLVEVEELLLGVEEATELLDELVVLLELDPSTGSVPQALIKTAALLSVRPVTIRWLKRHALSDSIIISEV
jgi:hypothetical protein